MGNGGLDLRGGVKRPVAVAAGEMVEEEKVGVQGREAGQLDVAGDRGGREKGVMTSPRIPPESLKCPKHVFCCVGEPAVVREKGEDERFRDVKRGPVLRRERCECWIPKVDGREVLRMFVRMG